MISIPVVAGMIPDTVYIPIPIWAFVALARFVWPYLLAYVVLRAVFLLHAERGYIVVGIRRTISLGWYARRGWMVRYRWRGRNSFGIVKPTLRAAWRSARADDGREARERIDELARKIRGES